MYPMQQQQQQQMPVHFGYRFHTEESKNHPLLDWNQDVKGSNFYEARIQSVYGLIRSRPMNMSVVDFFLHILSRDSDYANSRTSFMRNERNIGALLNLIVGDKDGKKSLDLWLRSSKYAANLTCEDIGQEMESVKPLMKAPTKDLQPDAMKRFNFEDQIAGVLETKAPTLCQVLFTAAHSSSAFEIESKKSPRFISAVVFAQLCNSRSQTSLLLQHNMGIFLYSTGASRLTIDFLSNCGLSSSFSTILRALKVISQRLLLKASEIARGPHMLGFDNEQISMSQHVSQRPGTEPAVRSFTASVIYPLRNATPQACRLQPILERRKNCTIITYNEHLIPSYSQQLLINEHLTIDILQILKKRTKGLDGDCYAELFQHPKHRSPPPGYQTQEFILPTLQYDESKTADLIRFIETLYGDRLKVPEEILESLAIISVNDQMLNSRGRSALLERAGDESAFLRMENLQLAVGFFHDIMNLAWQIRCIHNGSSEVTGSIANYISFLGVKRLGGDRPDYFTLRTFFYDILDANVLYLWYKKTGYENLEEYIGTNPAPAELKSIAEEILFEFASDKGLAICTGSGAGESDNVLKNAILLNRDLLFFYEHDCTVSSGDFGRLELLLGVLARMFNGAGARNYSNELLHLIQNLSISWPEDFANVMRDNLLISVLGHDGHYMGVDLNMEHNINIQKRFFAAKGVHGTADHLEHLSPASVMFRHFRRQFATMVGSWSGSTHKTPDRSSILQRLILKIRDSRIYSLDLKRNGIVATKDILFAGGQTLKKTGLKQFEKNYRAWANNEGEAEVEWSVPDDYQVAFDFGPEDLEVPEDQLAHDDD